MHSDASSNVQRLPNGNQRKVRFKLALLVVVIRSLNTKTRIKFFLSLYIPTYPYISSFTTLSLIQMPSKRTREFNNILYILGFYPAEYTRVSDMIS